MNSEVANLEDGLLALQREFGLKEIGRLIERTARWVAPETFKLLPIWFPEHARGQPFYKNNWSEPQHNKNRRTKEVVHKHEGNVFANKALCLALGITSKMRPNWTCCHIWGRDDPKYQEANTVVADHRFYSCIGNMLLVPTPLKAFTDSMPDVKAMLRICATNLYGWSCDHEDIGPARVALEEFGGWDCYPESWPRPGSFSRPMGTVNLSETIASQAKKRLRQITKDLNCAGEYYPRQAVLASLAYWRVDLSKCI